MGQSMAARLGRYRVSLGSERHEGAVPCRPGRGVSGSGASMCKGPGGADSLPAVFMDQKEAQGRWSEESRGGV